ncbi:MAG: hypothetical protein H6807_02965 [Planctomycetes bacterium]|nr:hypothetical protein [Planctomycetota bacterium]
MRGHHEADERQRIVHYLVRELADESGAVEHLDAEDLAGLVSGTLLKTELGRVENHLLACPACRRRAIDLQADFEAGVVPMLLRRPALREDGGRLFGRRLPRRWTPWILGAVAAVLAIALPMTEILPFGASRRSVRERHFVFRRLGSPQLIDAEDGEVRPVEPGGFVDPGQEIVARPGDYIEALKSDGEVVALVEGRWRQRDPGDLFSKRFFDRAEADRPTIRDLAAAEPEAGRGLGDVVRVIHPLRRIHDLRPSLRWAGGSGGQGFEIRVFDEDDDRQLFKRVEDGYAIHWPDEVLSLRPGGRYRIEVQPRPVSRDLVAKLRFEVVGGVERDEIDRDLVRIAALGGAGPSMLRAEYFRQRGLHAEAREELERLRRADSENVELLMRLKVAYRRLGLGYEESRLLTIVEKRR